MEVQFVSAMSVGLSMVISIDMNGYTQAYIRGILHGTIHRGVRWYLLIFLKKCILRKFDVLRNSICFPKKSVDFPRCTFLKKCSGLVGPRIWNSWISWLSKLDRGSPGPKMCFCVWIFDLEMVMFYGTAVFWVPNGFHWCPRKANDSLQKSIDFRVTSIDVL